MLSLSRTLATRLLTHAQSSPDARICGLLLAKDGAPHDIVALRNISAKPAAAHAIDSAEFQNAVQHALTRGLAPLAVYHSHPDSPPVPSAEDLAARPDAALGVLVISLNTKGVLELRAFNPDGPAVREIPAHIFL